MKPLLVFDLDGTLVDSANDIATALNNVLLKYDRPRIPHPKIVEHIGDGLKKLLLDFFPEHTHNLAKQEELEKEFLLTYEDVMLQDTKIFPGVTKFLDSWDGPIGIITNKNERPAKVLIEHLGLHKYPWIDIFGADTLAEKKPSPLPLRTLMQKAQHSPQSTVMIGDGTPDILSAKAAGVSSIAIGFGYTDVNILMGLGAKAALNHYDEMHKTLKNIGY